MMGVRQSQHPCTVVTSVRMLACSRAGPRTDQGDRAISRTSGQERSSLRQWRKRLSTAGLIQATKSRTVGFGPIVGGRDTPLSTSLRYQVATASRPVLSERRPLGGVCGAISTRTAAGWVGLTCRNLRMRLVWGALHVPKLPSERDPWSTGDPT